MKIAQNPVYRYFSEVKTEMSKVTWPTRKTIINHTVLVITISLIIAGFLGGLDFVFSKGLELLITS